MCGIVGISAETNVAAEIYDSLLMLQHRGHDLCAEALKENHRFQQLRLFQPKSQLFHTLRVPIFSVFANWFWNYLLF